MPAAGKLIASHGSLGAAIAADVDLLTEELEGNRRAALHLVAVRDAMIAAARFQIENRPLISNGAELSAYLSLALAHERAEQTKILFLNGRNRLIFEDTFRGCVDETTFTNRQVIARALQVGASGIILIHNHPSGDITPSQADVDRTRQLIRAARSVQLWVHDHLIVGSTGITSFRQRELI